MRSATTSRTRSTDGSYRSWTASGARVERRAGLSPSRARQSIVALGRSVGRAPGGSQQMVAHISRHRYGARHALAPLLVRGEEEALAALPGGTGPGALTARADDDRGPPGNGGSEGRGHRW